MRLDRAGSIGLHVEPLRFGPKIIETCTRNVADSRRCFLRDSSCKSETKGLPKVARSAPRGLTGPPMASQGHPKILELAAFLGKWSSGGPGMPFGSISGAFWEHLGVQRGSRDAVWKHFGNMLGAFGEFEQLQHSRSTGTIQGAILKHFGSIFDSCFRAGRMRVQEKNTACVRAILKHVWSIFDGYFRAGRTPQEKNIACVHCMHVWVGMHVPRVL